MNGVFDYTPARKRIYQDGGGSATAFAAQSKARWVLQGFALGWANALNSCTISLYEIDSTNSQAFFVFQVSATSGMRCFYLGDIGYQASSSYSSRMVFNVGAVTGTYTGLFSGYYVGGG